MDWMTGSSTVHWDVPYLYRGAGDDPPGPLVVALHGMGENEEMMRRRLRPLEGRGCRLLVPRAPYPIENRVGDRIRIGHAWYQYDGDEDRFVVSMDRTARYLFPLIDELAAGDNGPSRTVLLGFSQGAYLGYYLALRHPDRFCGVVGVAGRPKDEVLGPYLAEARDVAVLHLHGADDPVVSAEACRESVEALASAGLDARFERLPGGHEITRAMVERVREWLDTITTGP